MTSHTDMEDLKDKYDGERIFLIGNGPSLSETPLEKLNNEYTFAMKKINDIYPQTSWRPDFYHNHIPLKTEKNKIHTQEHVKNGATCFIPRDYSGSFENGENVFFYKSIDAKFEIDSQNHITLENTELERLYDYWSNDITECIYECHSMYIAMQISNYLGFDEMYLVGADMGIGKPDPHMIFDAKTNPKYYASHKSPINKYISDIINNEELFRGLINGVSFKVLNVDSKTEGVRIFNTKTRPKDYSSNDKVDYLKDSIKNKEFFRAIIIGIWAKYKLPLRELYAKLLINHGIVDLPQDNFSNDYHDSIEADWGKLTPGNIANRQITKSHVISHRILKKEGVKIYNATLGGELEIYPRVDLLDILTDSQERS